MLFQVQHPVAISLFLGTYININNLTYLACYTVGGTQLDYNTHSAKTWSLLIAYLKYGGLRVLKKRPYLLSKMEAVNILPSIVYHTQIYIVII